MEIIEMFLTPNKFSRPQIPLKKVEKIAVHYNGGAGATAQNVRDYFESLKDQLPDSSGKYWVNKDGTYRTWKGEKIAIRWVSSHFVVGLGGEVIQCIPTDEYSYCTNQANGYSISIECCHPDTTGKFTEATEKSLAELCAYLCRKFDLNPMDDIIRHYDVTGKQCPLYWSPTKYTSKQTADVRFKAFKKSVAEIMGATAETAEKGNSFRVRVLDVALNIRSAPGTSNKITGVIRDNGVYTIVEVKKVGGVEWGRLKSGIGWISLGNKYVIKL